ncbi:hypothetical protein BH11ARM1_BH11ARM1_11220 [soil metagenome]
MDKIWSHVDDLPALTDFLKHFSFHDGVIKEVHWVNRSFVSKNLRMAVEEQASVRMLVQRQWPNPSAIEILFEGVTGLELDSTNFIYYADPKQTDDGILELTLSGSWIAFKSFRWRDASDWMDESTHFGLDWHQ